MPYEQRPVRVCDCGNAEPHVHLAMPIILASAALTVLLVAGSLLAASRPASDDSPRRALAEVPSPGFSDGTSPSPALAPGAGSEGTAVPTSSMPAHSTRTGWATWYDDGSGFYGAVHSWRWGDDPYAVQVCLAAHPGTCTHVVVRDFCACGSRNGDPTLIDLSPSAFRELAPLSRGVIRVIVTGRIEIPLPPTDEVTP